MKLEWNVFYYDMNGNKITTYNIFKRCSYNEYLKEAFKKCKTKDEFAEVLRRELQYYFWSRAEWELIIEITEDNRIFLIPWCGCRNPEETKIDVTDDATFDWRGFAELHISKQIYKNKAKIDVYSQLTYGDQLDRLVDYLWDIKLKYKHRNPKLDK